MEKEFISLHIYERNCTENYVKLNNTNVKCGDDDDDDGDGGFDGKNQIFSLYNPAISHINHYLWRVCQFFCQIRSSSFAAIYFKHFIVDESISTQ